MEKRRSWFGMWALLLLLPLVGCRGCTQSSTSKDTAKEEELKKKKQRLVADELRTLPYTKDNPLNVVKPGHWYQVRNKVKANYGDESLTVAISVVDREGNPLSPGWGNDSVFFMRDLSLATGQDKVIDAAIFHPFLPAETTQETESGVKRTTTIRTRYSLRGIGTLVLEENFPCNMFEGYQYDFVVLSRDISRHLFWRGLDSIVWRQSEEIEANRVTPHRVVDINEDEIAAQLPSRLATMTSMSHLVINDINLSVLNPEQQLALSDWLHFGGTIIINGPEAVASMESSQLKEWAPLTNTSEGEWTEESQLEFDSAWTIRIAGGERIRFQSDRKIPILSGTLAPGANWVPTLDGLVAERLIGQGRVVMTTFPLTDAAFLRWPSYSSFIHNAILRKPHRAPTLGTDASTQYADSFRGTERNPIHSTRLRMWARDLDATTERTESEVLEKGAENAGAKFAFTKKTSFGAWNPSSSVVEQATLCLRESSGISVPKVETILKLLLGYLVVLVPVNWLFFRLLRRVELAWVAAPVIAMLGAVYVAGSVRLDVGFSRSQTSFGFLECHNDYPRGMLSSYYALYTSLSTNYAAVYKEGNGIVAPVLRATGRTGSRDKQELEYWNADDRGVGLQRFPVLSNSTGILQSEEMVELSGPLRWQLNSDKSKIQVINESTLPVRDIGVLGVDEQGKLVTSWIGSIEPGQSIAESVQIASDNQRWFEQWESDPILRKPDLIRESDGLLWTENAVDDVYLGAMLLTVAQRYPLQVGEYIAIGWTDANPSLLEISPTSSQQKHKTVVLMHIRPASMGNVQPDTRIFANLEKEEN
jgi:hypothetical protein